jgi:hypothetical protein
MALPPDDRRPRAKVDEAVRDGFRPYDDLFSHRTWRYRTATTTKQAATSTQAHRDLRLGAACVSETRRWKKRNFVAGTRIKSGGK